MVTRRNVLFGGASLLAMLGVAGVARSGAGKDQAAGKFEVTRTEAEWRKLLSPEAYHVLREHGTEYAGTSPLDHEKRAGTFACAGCGLPLFSSKTKFDSGTGWPSFWRPLPNAIGTSKDWSMGPLRIEVHCRRCGGHLGHVFDDGPEPTGKRYCMNGVAMTFTPSPAG